MKRIFTKGERERGREGERGGKRGGGGEGGRERERRRGYLASIRHALAASVA